MSIYYDYVNEKNDLLYQVGKEYAQDGKKTFVQRRKTDAGYVYELGDVRRVLYRLPQLIEASTRGQTIYVVEGEKDADNLARLGLVATTNAGGACKWLDGYNAFFVNCNVVVLRDNDLMGERHAYMVATNLLPVVNGVKVVLLPALLAKGDVSDWLAEGRGADELLAAIAAAEDEYPALRSADDARDAEQQRLKDERAQAATARALSGVGSSNIIDEFNRIKDICESLEDAGYEHRSGKYWRRPDNAGGSPKVTVYADNTAVHYSPSDKMHGGSSPGLSTPFSLLMLKEFGIGRQDASSQEDVQKAVARSAEILGKAYSPEERKAYGRAMHAGAVASFSQKSAGAVVGSGESEDTLYIEDDSFPALPENARLPDALAAGACDWLDRYVDFSKKWSPSGYDDFHAACGLWLLSVVSARRVVLGFGGEWHTGLYIMLCSRSGATAKTTTARIATNLLKAAGLRYMLAPDRITPQEFLGSLTTQLPMRWSNMKEKKRELVIKRMAFAGQRGWFYDEFGQMIEGMMNAKGINADFRHLLRCFDDGADYYEYSNRSRDDDIDRPYLALLANTTPADMVQYAGKRSPLWSDGFLARFAIITPPKDFALLDDDFPEGDQVFPDDLLQPIRDWHEQLGVPEVELCESDGLVPTVEVSESSKQYCVMGLGVKDAYSRYRRALRSLIMREGSNTDLDASCVRLPLRALRVAMLLASLENGGRIEMRHWAKAQQLSETWRRGVHNLLEQLQSGSETAPSRESALESKLLKRLCEAGTAGCTINDVRRYIKNVGIAELGAGFESLAAYGVVRSEVNRLGKKRYFLVKLPESPATNVVQADTGEEVAL